MNREILFRGKKPVEYYNMIDNSGGKWVEGYLITLHDGQSPAIQSEIKIVPDYVGARIDSKIFCVIPETVGQYTGLTDKNDNRIFEGDVLKMEIKSNYINPLQSPLVFIGVCKFKDGAFGFSKQRADIEEFTAFSSTTYNVEFEIIGNIHDNSDLLK